MGALGGIPVIVGDMRDDRAKEDEGGNGWVRAGGGGIEMEFIHVHLYPVSQPDWGLS